MPSELPHSIVSRKLFSQLLSCLKHHQQQNSTSMPSLRKLVFVLLAMVLLAPGSSLSLPVLEKDQKELVPLATAGAVSPLGQGTLSLRPDWLQQKVRPDSEWQRKMELMLGRTSLIRSAEQELLQNELAASRAARKNNPNDSFRAAIKQILLGIH